MWFVSLLVLILILGIIILVHEFGHFIWAKKFGVHIYEFSIGMGPVVHTHKGKDGIDYNIRALPIGGFVAMAGEVYEDDETNKIPKEKFMCNRPWWQRIIILVAGVVNNFILALVLLFAISMIWGGGALKPEIKAVKENYPMAQAGAVAGDVIVSVDGKKVTNWDSTQIRLYMKNNKDYYEIGVKHENGKVDTLKVTPLTEKDQDGNERQVFGMEISNTDLSGFVGSIKYAFHKFGSVVESMWLTIGGLFTGRISVTELSGPVGMYEVIDTSIDYGISYIMSIFALLSINVGFLNILPFPAFDGGRVFFLVVEKIKGSPVNEKFENICHTIGFFLLIALMIFITIKDIIHLF